MLMRQQGFPHICFFTISSLLLPRRLPNVHSASLNEFSPITTLVVLQISSDPSELLHLSGFALLLKSQRFFLFIYLDHLKNRVSRIMYV